MGSFFFLPDMTDVWEQHEQVGEAGVLLAEGEAGFGDGPHQSVRYSVQKTQQLGAALQLLAALWGAEAHVCTKHTKQTSRSFMLQWKRRFCRDFHLWLLLWWWVANLVLRSKYLNIESNRKGVNNTNDAVVLFKCPSKSWQCDSEAACTIPGPWNWSNQMEFNHH